MQNYRGSGDNYRPSTFGRGRGSGRIEANRFIWGSNYNRRIPPPPRTPCASPLDMPFSKLRSLNAAKTMTLDEELLRAIIGQFTVKAASCLPFLTIFEKLKRENGHLTTLLYDDPDYVWSYILCYPEQFTIDRDPRYPDFVWYLSKSKLVAKSDRRRYERELNAGNIKVCEDEMNDENLNRLRYDESLERQALSYVIAIFVQLRKKLTKGNNCAYFDVPTKFIRASFENGYIPSDVRDYVGASLEQFLYHRLHVFNVFGSQVGLRSNAYVDALRTLTEKLNSVNGCCNLKDLYQFSLSSPYLGRSGLRAIAVDPSKFEYDDFLLFLHGQKLLFRLRPRDRLVELRHGVVPPISTDDIENVPEYPTINSIRSIDDLTSYQVCDNNAAGRFSTAGFGGGGNFVETTSKEAVVPEPSFYTVRWLSENFDSMCGVQMEDPNDHVTRKGRRKAKKSNPLDDSAAIPKTTESSDGWPSLDAASAQYQSCVSSNVSSTTTEEKRFKLRELEAEIESEWNGCS